MAANTDEVRLRKGSPLRERLIWAGSGAVLLLILVPGLIAWAWEGRPLLVALWAVPLGLFLIGVAAFEPNVAWIITPDGIAIGEQRPLGQLRKRMVDLHEIAGVSVRKNRFSYPASYSLACMLASGDVLVSPPLPDITRVNETAETVAALLGVPAAAPIDNPLDADNPEIRLGAPLTPARGWLIWMIVPAASVLCTMPFLIALWIGETELALGLLLPLGLFVAFALYRNAYRLSGAVWRIRHGEIVIERMALNGAVAVETIHPADVAAIEVDKPDRRGRTCTISIRLHTGRTFRSPKRYDENGASAVRAEIVRRLHSPSEAEH